MYLRTGAVGLAVLQMSFGDTLQPDAKTASQTPIKHVIVIVGENRTFDHVFATYIPKTGEHVDNLLSKNIIREDGTPGPNYSLASQYSARDTHRDGHPASSKLNLFEGFVKKIVDAVQSNPELWKSTAIFVTVDEGGGYYDSGYIQPLDFFGDPTRIPMIVVSPYTKPGHISHTYADHASVLKFVERNWKLGTISDRSRDNLPNPEHNQFGPYIPSNSPAIGDLFDLLDFNKHM